MGGDWRQGVEYAWQQPNSEPDEGPGLTWRQLAPRPIGTSGMALPLELLRVPICRVCLSEMGRWSLAVRRYPTYCRRVSAAGAEIFLRRGTYGHAS